MKQAMLLVMFLISCILLRPSFGKEIISDAYQISEAGWLENGLVVADSDNVKSENGFGAQLWLTSDDSIYDTWDTSAVPKLETTNISLRNKPIFAIFLFINPGIDIKSQANVTADVTIISPDGEIYGEFQDMEVWQREYAFVQNTIQLSVGNLGIMIENEDQLGVYTIKAIINDQIKNIKLELKTEFTAQEN